MYMDPEIYERSYEGALNTNERNINKIEHFKKELQDVRQNLESNQKQLYQNVLVPIGSKAFIKGKLVHTNEVTINVGDRWFVKKSATSAIETCNRMIERCNLNLAELEKEKNLLSSNLEIPSEYEVFPSSDVQEIIEPFDEQEEKKWKEKHRERVREYKQKLAVNREVEEFDDIFKKLEKLEEDEEGDLDEDDEDIKEDEYQKLIEESIKLNENIPLADSDINCVPKKAFAKRVSFSESLEQTQEYSPSADDDPDEENVILFQHSKNPGSPSTSSPSSNNENIKSPADIYKVFLSKVDSVCPKSILKKTAHVGPSKYEISIAPDYDSSSSEEDSDEDNVFNDGPVENVQNSIAQEKIKSEHEMGTALIENDREQIEILGDIIEKTPETMLKQNNVRPPSKFKLSRVVKH